MNIDRREKTVRVVYYVQYKSEGGVTKYQVQRELGEEELEVLPAEAAMAYVCRRLEELSRENDSLRVGLVPVDEEVRSAERRKIRGDMLAYINARGTGDPYRWGDEVQGDDLRTMVDRVIPSAEVRG